MDLKRLPALLMKLVLILAVTITFGGMIYFLSPKYDFYNIDTRRNRYTGSVEEFINGKWQKLEDIYKAKAKQEEREFAILLENEAKERAIRIRKEKSAARERARIKVQEDTNCWGVGKILVESSEGVWSCSNVNQ